MESSMSSVYDRRVQLLSNGFFGDDLFKVGEIRSAYHAPRINGWFVWHPASPGGYFFNDDEVVAVDEVTPVKDASSPTPGGSTNYYNLPANATDLADLIEHKAMNFNRGNIFKAAYRLGEKDTATELYDLNKIIWFAEREKKRIENNV